MQRQSLSLIIFSVVLGFVCGIAILLWLATSIGLVGETTEPLTSESKARPLTGMERLENYRCSAGETKQVLIGGIEDNYDPAGNEIADHSVYTDRYTEDAKTYYNNYDDATQNRGFIDSFDIPKDTFHGMFVIRLKENSRNKNDQLALTYFANDPLEFKDKSIGLGELISGLKQNPNWSHDDDLYWTELEDLMLFKADGKGTQVGPFLDAIRAGQELPLALRIIDDTQVDFAGFAICLEPQPHEGYIYSPHSYNTLNPIVEFGPNILGLWPSKVAGEMCEPWGCLSCREERPVTCIKDENLEAPDFPHEIYEAAWTGGTLKFTRPVQGDSFETEDDVHAFCQAEFGEEWRVLSRHDGNWEGSLISYGEAPTDYNEYWVAFKDQPHANCWKLRDDYPTGIPDQKSEDLDVQP